MYEVAVVAPLPQPLTYAGPPETGATVSPGQRVLVPLGRRQVTGYVLGPADPHPAESKFTVKPITELLDTEPVFPPELIPLYRWIAEYYHFPIGEVIRTAVPGGLTTESGGRIRLTPQGRDKILGAGDIPEKAERTWISRLLDKGELSPASVTKLKRQSSARSLLKKWEKNDWISVESEIRRNQFKIRRETCVQLSADCLALIGKKDGDGVQGFLERFEQIVPGLKKSEIKTLSLIYEHLQQEKAPPLFRPKLTKKYAGAGKALHSLEQRKILSLEKRRVYRDPFGRQPQYHPQPDKLTSEQEAALAELLPSIRNQSFQPFLLHGITGCGKTEVYLQASAEALAVNKNVLVLVPEIVLASQIEPHFHSRFGDELAILHSGLSAGERHDQWQRISSGQAKIVVGARSAVFAPLTNIGLIIVDEEHEPAYKQDDGLHYNGRDLAVLRGRFEKCPVLLGSATPSVTSYHHAVTGKYKLLEMKNRVNEQKLPEVQIINLAEEKKSRPDLFFSDQLINALWENMENRRQSLLFVNRRGFASFMLCRDCGHIVQCRHCHVSLTMHRHEQRLICHYCGYSISTDIVCPACGSSKVVGLGLGSERIEDEVQQLIPHARVARLDSDTATNRKQYMKTLQSVSRLEVDILIGTQMIAKGLHFPNITLVGVVWADSGLGIPDFRASERTFQLLSQVTGRAGRGDHPGKVIIQTYRPSHYSVQYAQQHNYGKFYKQEVSLRRDLSYPPFSRLVNIQLSGTDEDGVEKNAYRAARFLRQCAAALGRGEVDILGPAPAPLVRIKNKTRWQLLLKSSNLPLLHSVCARLQEKYPKIGSARVKMTIDVDPENMM